MAKYLFVNKAPPIANDRNWLSRPFIRCCYHPSRNSGLSLCLSSSPSLSVGLSIQYEAMDVTLPAPLPWGRNLLTPLTRDKEGVRPTPTRFTTTTLYTPVFHARCLTVSRWLRSLLERKHFTIIPTNREETMLKSNKIGSRTDMRSKKKTPTPCAICNQECRENTEKAEKRKPPPKKKRSAAKPHAPYNYKLRLKVPPTNEGGWLAGLKVRAGAFSA